MGFTASKSRLLTSPGHLHPVSSLKKITAAVAFDTYIEVCSLSPGMFGTGTGRAGLTLHLGPPSRALACQEVLHTIHFEERKMERAPPPLKLEGSSSLGGDLCPALQLA